MTRIKTITIDIDDVVFHTSERLVRMACEKLGEPYTALLCWKGSNFSENVRKEFWRLACSPVLFMGDICHCDIPYALNNLLADKKFDVRFVSARMPNQITGTLRQFEKYGIKVNPDRVFLSGGKSKIPVLKDIVAGFHIDDGADNIQECLDNNINAALISPEHLLHNHHMREFVPHYPNLVAALHANKFIR
ncbi:MAG: hypothetical protein FWG39_02655 [Alphaproteobacteria bacterium]|nr:hypothetical protein [Alphaproteobacteria bacterium]